MIAVYEPLCKSVSHEKVNSGFLYGLRLAFPSEEIVVFADSSHILALKNILEYDGIVIENIRFYSIHSNSYPLPVNILVQSFLLWRLLKKVKYYGETKIFFLSFTPDILFVIKMLKCLKGFGGFKFTFVLHGGFETIADGSDNVGKMKLPRNRIVPNVKRSVLRKFIESKPKDLPRKIFNKISAVIYKNFKFIKAPNFFSVKRMMEWRCSNDFKFIALSPHILKSAYKYLDSNKVELCVVLLPTKFAIERNKIKNDHAKFAVFGFGDSLVLHNIGYLLSQRGIENAYEIRVIGMDNRGIEDFPMFTCYSDGQLLSRAEMERQAADIDAFLILYGADKYRLSCSGSILESLSMIKPVIHFDNDCINFFNTEKLPIGIRAKSLDEYVDKLVGIINNYSKYLDIFLNYEENIKTLRFKYSIEKSVPSLRESFSWPCSK